MCGTTNTAKRGNVARVSSRARKTTPEQKGWPQMNAPKPEVQQARSESGHQGLRRGSAGPERNHEEASGLQRLSQTKHLTLEKSTPQNTHSKGTTGSLASKSLLTLLELQQGTASLEPV